MKPVNFYDRGYYGGKDEFSAVKKNHKETKKLHSDDFDDECKTFNRFPIGRGRHSHWYCDAGVNSQPLKRLLEKNIGRPWAKVYSELCKNHSKTFDRYNLEHCLSWMVSKEAQDPLWNGWNFRVREGFYVDEKGLLQNTPEDNSWKYRHNPRPPVAIDDKYIKVKGVWYEYTFAIVEIPKWMEKFTQLVQDRKMGRDNVYSQEIRAEYGQYVKISNTPGCIKSRRQLNSREIKKLRLNERLLENS